MTRTEHVENPGSPPVRTQKIQRALFAGTVTLLLVIAATYTVDGQWSTAAGVLTGGGLVLGLMLLAEHRAARHGAEAGTASRVFGSRADERDSRVFVATLATVGLVSLAVAALGLVVVGLGVDPVVVLRAMPYALFGTGVVAFIVIDRRT